MERQHKKNNLMEFQNSRTSPTHNRQMSTVDRSSHATTTSQSDKETDNFYTTIDNTLERQTEYITVMGDFNAKVEGQTNTSERATGCFDLGQRNERETLGRMGNIKEFQDHEHSISEDCR